MRPGLLLCDSAQKEDEGLKADIGWQASGLSIVTDAAVHSARPVAQTAPAENRLDLSLS
jgi:hypothetical protein